MNLIAFDPAQDFSVLREWSRHGFWRAQRLGAKIDAIAPSAVVRDRARPSSEPRECPQIAGFSSETWKHAWRAREKWHETGAVRQVKTPGPV